jgi:3-oxoadipate enol-lactonase
VTVTADHVDTSLGRLYVEVTGAGEPMLMWPSLLTDHTLFDAQVSHFRERYTTVTVDPPGQGRSDPLDRPFTFAECARCYVEILDALGFDRAHLVGNSWGAMIGGTVAATYPERVGCAVLMNGTGSVAPLWSRLKDKAWILAVRRLGRVPMVERAIVPRFLGRTTRRHRPDLVRRLVDVISDHEARSLTMAVESIVVRRPDQHALFGTISTPVLVITGRQDASFPVREVRRMAQAIPGAEFVVLPDAGHLVSYEAPEAVNRLVEDFLARHA